MTVSALTDSDGKLADALADFVRRAHSVRGRTAATWRTLTDVVTRLGWGVLSCVAVSFVLGYRLGWTELVAVAWAGSVLVVSGLLHLLGRTAYEIDLTMPVDRVVVGDRVPGLVSVRNPSRRRLPGVIVEVPIGQGRAEFAMPSLGRESQFDDVFIVPTRRRGVIPVGPVQTVRSDPIGLFRKELVWAGQIDLYVHPRTISIPSMSTGLIRDLEGNPTRDLTNSDVSFHALREYVPGDERRTIHWKSSAKTGTYMVRQFEQSRRSHMMVALSIAASDFATDDEFEMAVSVAGSLGVRAIRDGRSLSVVTGNIAPASARGRPPGIRNLSTLTPPRLLDDLSRVEVTDRAFPIEELARVAGDTVAGMSVAFLVCGSVTTLAQLRAASTKFPLGVEVVAVICDPEIVPSLRRVGSLSVLTIGFLDDLQKSLARTAAE